MDPNNSKETVEHDLLEESDFSSFSSATGMDPMDEEIQKLKAKLQQIKEANLNQFGGSSMKQMGSQIEEKFGKMEKEIDGLKSANHVEIGAFEGLKKEFEKMAGENAGLKEKMDKMNEEFAGKMAKMEKKIKEIEAKNAKLEGHIVEKNEENGKMKAEIQGLDEENGKMKVEINKMKTEFCKIVEFEAKMRELQEKKAYKEMLVQFKNNKWNAADCGPKLSISEDGIVVKHSNQDERNSIRAVLPIPPFNLNSKKPSIAGYYEVQIITKGQGRLASDIDIGFCTKQFPLEGNWLGNVENSIGIWRKEGMHIDGRFNKFGNNANVNEFFNFGNVIGVGIIHSPANKSMKCFATCNGQLLEAFELPDKFASLQLFPAVTSFNTGNSIRANFGQQKWRFNPSQLLQ